MKRSGKQVMNVPAGTEAVVCGSSKATCVAVIGENRKLLSSRSPKCPNSRAAAASSCNATRTATCSTQLRLHVEGRLEGRQNNRTWTTPNSRNGKAPAPRRDGWCRAGSRRAESSDIRLALNRGRIERVPLVPNESRNVIFSNEHRASTASVLFHAHRDVRSYTRIKRAVSFAGQDVNKAAGHSLRSFAVPASSSFAARTRGGWVGGSSPPMEDRGRMSRLFV
jgi:hypothetical protein